MDPQRYAEKLISEAIERGEMEPADGSGKPFEDLRDDPDWWVRALFEREAMPERFAEVDAFRAKELGRAVGAPDLPSARRILAALNGRLERWNASAAADFRFEMMDEIWLLDRRAGRPAD